jgi:hypothetical protein
VSQRTRAHTTGAAPKPTNAMTHDEPANAAPPARRGRRKATIAAATPAEEPHAASSTGQGGAVMSSDALARALRAVAAELERDPALARRVASAIDGASECEQAEREVSPEPSVTESRVEATLEETPVATIGRTFHPSIVTGVTPDLGAGVPDPFALRERLGLDGLRAALESLRLGSLRAIVRQHKLDPSGRLSKLNDAAKLRERIVQAAMERA